MKTVDQREPQGCVAGKIIIVTQNDQRNQDALERIQLGFALPAHLRAKAPVPVELTSIPPFMVVPLDFHHGLVHGLHPAENEAIFSVEKTASPKITVEEILIEF